MMSECTDSQMQWLKHISEKTREARKHVGLSQQKLAELADLPLDFIVRIEAAETSPSHMAVGKIAGATGKPLSFWYDEASK